MTDCDALGSPTGVTGVAIATLVFLMLLALSSCAQDSGPA